MTNTLSLPKSAEAYGTPSFADVLLTELTGKEYELPLEAECTMGGWPQDVEIIIEDTDDDEEYTYVRVRVDFDETIPTSCSEITMPEPRSLRADIAIAKATGEATVEVSE